MLCGKPLSRIRVGGGEEFCSREHRTQYRLRRGMDRLQEANKVASLMRRRETPKPIAVSPIADKVWRGYFKALPNAQRTIQLPRRTGWSKPMLGLPAATIVTVHPSGHPRRVERRAANPRFHGGSALELELPSPGGKNRCGLPQAQAVIRPSEAPASSVERRPLDALRRGESREVVPPKSGKIRARNDGAAAAEFLAVAQDVSEGAILRVSRAVGFRVTSPKVFRFKPDDPRRPAFEWPRVLGHGPASTPAASRREAAAEVIPFPKRPMDSDHSWSPKPDLGPGMRPPEVRQVATSIKDSEAAVRIQDSYWNRDDDTMRLPERSRTIQSPHLSSALRLIDLANRSAAHEAAPRVSILPFGSGDVTLGYSEEEQYIQ